MSDLKHELHEALIKNTTDGPLNLNVESFLEDASKIVQAERSKMAARLTTFQHAQRRDQQPDKWEGHPGMEKVNLTNEDTE